MPANTPTGLTDLQLLRSLASFAAQTSDEHLLLPVFSAPNLPRHIATQLRDMADSITPECNQQGEWPCCQATHADEFSDKHACQYQDGHEEMHTCECGVEW